MISTWIPPVTTTAMFALAAWIGLPKILAASIERAVQHQFDERLERLRGEIRSAETSIDALRAGALSGVTARQTMLDSRRLLAAERLWAAVNAMGSAKSLAALLGEVDLVETLKRAEGNSAEARKTQHFAAALLKSMLPGGYQFDAAPGLERPFLSAQAWSLFVAYRLAITHPVMIFTLVEKGLGSEMLKTDVTESLAIMKTALPEHSDYVDKHGMDGLHLLIPTLEERILQTLVGDLSGTESSDLTVAASAAILRKADALQADFQRAQAAPTPEGLQI